jgi:hypothetical protein
MGMPPKGKIVARPMVVRACGCEQEFQHFEVDKYRAQRLEKFQRTRCPACVAKLLEQQKHAAPVPKAEAVKRLPPGTQVSLIRRADGSWAGSLVADGTTVETAGEAAAGPQAVIGALAQLWLAARGVTADHKAPQRNA